MQRSWLSAQCAHDLANLPCLPLHKLSFHVLVLKVMLRTLKQQAIACTMPPCKTDIMFVGWMHATPRLHARW